MKKTILLTSLLVLTSITSYTSANESDSLNIKIHNSTQQDFPFTVTVKCESQPNALRFTLHDSQASTPAFLSPGAAPGTCTMTFSITNNNVSPHQSTHLPGSLETVTKSTMNDDAFLEMTPNTELSQAITTPIQASSDQATLSFNTDTLTVTIKKITSAS